MSRSTGCRARLRTSHVKWAFLLLVGGHALVLALDLVPGLRLPAREIVVVDNVAQLASACAAAVFAALVSRRADVPRARSGWALLAGGCAAWAAGQSVWTYYEVVAGRAVPFPSAADLGFLLFPVLATAGLLVLPTAEIGSRDRARDVLDGLVAAGSLLILSWASSLGSTVREAGRSDLATGLSIAYPLGDVMVLTLALLALARAPRASRRVFVPLASGVAALAVADSTFLYLTAAGSYSSGDLVGVGWTAGFGLIAIAAVHALHPGRVRGRQGPSTRPARHGMTSLKEGAADAAGRKAPSPVRLRLAAPYVPLLPAQLVVTVQLVSGDRQAPAVEVVLALVLVLLVLVRQFGVLADNHALLQALHAQREAARHAALHDPLTGLANRTLFADRVGHALTLRQSRATTTTVMFCDLDDFKTVNDGLGHAAGDALLVEVAARLRQCLRPGDTVARLGGDEFAVLLESTPATGDGSADAVARRLTTVIGRPVHLSGQLVRVSVSIGVASTRPSPALDPANLDARGTRPDAVDAAELIRRADTAMYLAKSAGKSTWICYDPDRSPAHPTPPARAARRPSPGMPAGAPAPRSPEAAAEAGCSSRAAGRTS